MHTCTQANRQTNQQTRETRSQTDTHTHTHTPVTRTSNCSVPFLTPATPAGTEVLAHVLPPQQVQALLQAYLGARARMQEVEEWLEEAVEGQLLFLHQKGWFLRSLAGSVSKGLRRCMGFLILQVIFFSVYAPICVGALMWKMPWKNFFPEIFFWKQIFGNFFSIYAPICVGALKWKMPWKIGTIRSYLIL